MNSKRPLKTSAGFTLVELMIVVVIIGILAAIAMPSYVNQVTEAKRSDGKIALMEAAQSLERCYSENNAYNDSSCSFDTTSPEGHYAITTPAITATSFTLQATPNASQTDPLCLNLTLTSTGVQGKSGSGTVEECWN